MLRALYHLAACTYYRWALSCMHPAHPDAGFVQLMHALHSAQLDTFLRTGR
ncbi:MAG TPA: hypothetical protein PKV98_17285 [Burkholderiaceae bacterium]|nr:hypothetical protein [Burkholderiaceae bacterium]